MISKLFSRRKKAARAERIRITPPTAAPDRHGIAIVAILKDEAKHIVEWVQFHRAAGVRHFIIYDNLSTDNTVALLHECLSAEMLTLIPWQMDTQDAKTGLILPRQVLAYCHAISTFGADYRWMTFIDIDEFLVPKIGNTLLEALEPLNRYSNISLSWTMYGFNGHQDPPEGLTIAQYKNRAANPLAKGMGFLNFKCIVDPCKVNMVAVHKFETTDMGAQSVNDQGVSAHNKLRKKASFLSDTRLQLNHYYTFSKAELDAKIARGGVSGASGQRHNDRVRLIATQIEQDTVEDLCAFDFWQRAQQDG
ncbi:hypothetical protein GCM10007939_17170 [Amylibacter marinus]|uniref:Glycosyltransferase family 92 n=2 Tax=Amylibacter marinus TaxID=1475483 RepID=A0ABQ5VWA9_9RHOB|nr:hypothetical protein GCM10007939_17170 [Amylibacter marinus]